MLDQLIFEMWLKQQEIVIPSFGVVWESGTNTFAVRNVATGELIVRTDYIMARKLADKWNKKTAGK